MPTKRPSPVKRIAPLSKRKKKLPLKFLAPALAMIITLAGVGVASQLAQRSQDLRSDASGCQFGATSCSNNTGLLWECDGNSFQEKPGPVICNQAAYDARYGNSNTNPDGSCKHGLWRCADGALQYCGDGKWQARYNESGNSYNCGGVNPPAAGQVCNDNDWQCRDGEWWHCKCYSGNCSWQHASSGDKSCTGDFYTWGQNPSQAGSPEQVGTGGANPGQPVAPAQPQPPAPVCRSEKTAELWVRTQSSTGAWSSWAGPNTAVDSTGQGLLTSFAMYSPINGPMGFGADLTQYAVKGGELWVRTGGLDRNWSGWAGPNAAVNNVGAGTLTSFSAVSDTVSMASSRKTVVKQYAVKGGELFVRSMTTETGWTGWSEPNRAADTAGSGLLTGFSMNIEPATAAAPNGLLKQYAVKGGELWVRTSVNGAQWTGWVGPNPAVASVGGKLISFDAARDVTSKNIMNQYATVEREIQVCN